jgi:hypothetical protein
MGKLSRCKQRFGLQDERGQAIVVIAFVMIALILFAGLALDAATIYAGETRLKRAIDSSALASVVELPNDVRARQRSEQFMLANGFDTADPDSVPSFETARIPATGFLQWAITATSRVRLNFLPMLNFDYVDVTQSSVAEYRSLVDIYTSQTGGSGIVGPVNLSVWGRWANPLYGDAFTPECWTCSDSGNCPETLSTDPATGRVLSCPAGSMSDETPNGFNPDNSELYNQFGQGYPFRIHIPAGYADDEIQIEILDPDGYNQSAGGTVLITHLDGVSETVPTDCEPAGDNDQRDACLIATGEDANPYWFVRLDENRCFSDANEGRPSAYTEEYNTTTEYTLYYNKELSDGSLVRVPIGNPYVGYATLTDDVDAHGESTDMKWVAAWNVDIVCNDGDYLGNPTCPANKLECCDTTGIVVNDDGSRSLLLEVDGVTGYSENGFDLWAGPPLAPAYADMPDNVNERNLYVLLDPASHDTGGVVVYGSGYLPLRVNTTEAITMTLAFVPPEAASVNLNLFHFDNDSGSAGAPQQIDYYLEGVSAWHQIGALSLDGTWGTSLDYVYQPPAVRDHDSLPIPDEYYGGYLKAILKTPLLDSSSWRLEYEGVVGDIFVRLIR